MAVVILDPLHRCLQHLRVQLDEFLPLCAVRRAEARVPFFELHKDLELDRAARRAIIGETKMLV